MDDPTGDEKPTSSPVDFSSVPCSICLDLVTDNGDRSIAKLQCGHEFHLDCIGSAFNVKGAMQCPNCRKVERGQWLFASGSTCSFPEFNVDDWTPDDYGLNYSEMPLGVHWCPFSGLAQVHSSFEDVESASTTYHNLQRHGVFAEPSSASSLAHSYLAYVGPIPPVSSNTNESVDDPNFNHRWNGISGQNEMFTAHGIPVIDVQYQTWGHHSHPFSSNSGHINRTDRPSATPGTLRPMRADYDAMARAGATVHPSVHGYGNIISRERALASHANGIHHQRQLSNPPGVQPPTNPRARRSNGPRGLATPQSDQSGGFPNFPPPGSSRRNLHESDITLATRIPTRETSQLPPAVLSFDWESVDSVWGPFRHANGGSDSTDRPGNFGPRHRS